MNKGSNTKVGAVIIFKDGADKDTIQEWLDELAEIGDIEPTTAHEYDPTWGGPVWYIP